MSLEHDSWEEIGRAEVDRVDRLMKILNKFDIDQLDQQTNVLMALLADEKTCGVVDNLGAAFGLKEAPSNLLGNLTDLLCELYSELR